MTLLIAKVRARISAHYAPDSLSIESLPAFRMPAFVPSVAWRRELLSGAFITLAVMAALVYAVTVNLIVLEGRKIPVFEAALNELAHEQKLKRAELAELLSPTAIKQQAVGEIKMVEISDINYVNSSESVASRMLNVP